MITFSTWCMTGNLASASSPVAAAYIAPRFALGGYPYAIRVFLGDVPQTGSLLFDQTPTQLGMVYNFSGPTEARGMGPEGCEYCDKQKAEQALSSGQVILTDYLVENIIKQETLRNIPLRTLNPDEVIPYLKENLHWRVTDVSPRPTSRSRNASAILLTP